MPLSCRFYADKYPETEDPVIVNVQQIAEMGAYVALLEYNNIGYIDLSKRRVYTKDLLLCEERYAKAKAVNSILTHVANQLGYDSDAQLEDLYDRTAWHFDRKFKQRAASYDIFKKAIEDPDVLKECEIDDQTREALLEDIRKRLTPQAVKIRADVEVSCFEYQGIDAVKDALNEGLKCSTDQMPIKINLIAPPQYVVTANTLDRSEGLAAVNTALAKIKESIEQSGGTYKVLVETKVVSDLEEKELRRKMELMELEGGEDGEGEEYNEEGMAAPKELDRQLDQEEKSNQSVECSS